MENAGISDREEHVGRLNSLAIDEGHIWYLHYSSYHADLFRAFGQYAKGKLLDIGCGNKPYQDVLNNISEYTGCDIVQSSDRKVDIICAANHIPLAEEKFDTVISTQTIEHVEDHQGLINEAYRLLKTDGYFILSGPLYWPLHEEPYDFFRFTKHGLTYLLKNAGFRVIEIHSNGGKWSVAGQAFLHALYPHIYQISGIKGRVARFAFSLFGGVRSVNRLFKYLDSKATDTRNTMNYVVVSQK
ncbi:MAG TPA: class I SAM-dependent methyltransferase [Mucilaginibacter sp.]